MELRKKSEEIINLLESTSIDFHNKEIAIQLIESELIKIVKLFNEVDVIKNFLIEYKFTDITDASVHNEVIEAKTSYEAISKLYEKYDFKIEWLTVFKQ